MKFTPANSRPAGPQDDTDHGHTLPGILEVLQQLRSDHGRLVEGIRDRGIKVYSDGARRLNLQPAAGIGQFDVTPRVLTSSPCELLGWVLTETGGVNRGAVTIADGDNSGFDDNDTLQLGIPAGGTIAHRWENGFPIVRGISVAWGNVGGATGTVKGWLLIR